MQATHTCSYAIHHEALLVHVTQYVGVAIELLGHPLPERNELVLNTLLIVVQTLPTREKKKF